MDDASSPLSHAPWLAIAEREEARGVAQTGANPRILEYLSSCADLTPEELRDDSTAWCAAFANWCMMQAGLPGTSSSWARDWFDWGVPDPAPGKGSIVVWKRGPDPAGSGPYGHVSFLIEDRGEDLLVLGGNQANAVCRSIYPRNGFLRGDYYSGIEFRRPA